LGIFRENFLNPNQRWLNWTHHYLNHKKLLTQRIWSSVCKPGEQLWETNWLIVGTLNIFIQDKKVLKILQRILQEILSMIFMRTFKDTDLMSHDQMVCHTIIIILLNCWRINKNIKHKIVIKTMHNNNMQIMKFSTFTIYLQSKK